MTHSANRNLGSTAAQILALINSSPHSPHQGEIKKILAANLRPSLPEVPAGLPSLASNVEPTF